MSEMICGESKKKLLNETREKIVELLDEVETKCGRKEALLLLAYSLSDYDLDFISGLVESDYEPSITNQWLREECCYSEGNEDAGHISLSTIIGFAEEILNKADNERSVTFGNKLVRRETPEEMHESGHSILIPKSVYS